MFRIILFLLSVTQVSAFPSISTSSMRRFHAALSPTRICSWPPAPIKKSLPSPLNFHTTLEYSTAIHLISKTYSRKDILCPSTSAKLSIRRLRNSARFNSPDENVEDEKIDNIDHTQNITNATIDTADEQREESSINEDNENPSSSLGMESGWSSFGRSLMRMDRALWTSSMASQSAIVDDADENKNLSAPSMSEEVDDADENKTVLEENSAVIRTLLFSTNGTTDGEERGAVIGVGAQEDSPFINRTATIKVNGTQAEPLPENKVLAKQLLRGTFTAILRGGKKLVETGKTIRDSRNDDKASSTIKSNPSFLGDRQEIIAGNVTEGENVSKSNATDASDPNNEMPRDGLGMGYHRGRRRRQTANQTVPVSTQMFTSLESKDINTTTMSKQRKWERRRRRTLLLYKAAKNSVFLFVFTFLAGNIMNQFVDLDEDGSFEVHFGKVLSSPSPSPSKPEDTQRKSLFHTIATPNQATPKQHYKVDGSRAQALGLVKSAVQQVGPAVVRVDTETELHLGVTLNGAKDQLIGNGNGELSNDGEDRGDIFDGVPEAPPPSDNKSGQNIDFGQGSGIIVNSEGYILTNAHVVEGATRVYVHLTDGRRFRAEMQGSDDIVDVAVLKIIPEETDDSNNSNHIMADLPVAQLGNSDQIEVGQFVTAIGSPGGLDNTCTIGIVSGLKRCPKVVGIPDKLGVLDYIQTDAAINQGNSGGPLVDVESGNIVGINTCIRANMEGTSFAIPINKVMGIVDDLSDGKHISHGYLGVHMSTMNPTLARYCNKVRQSSRKIPEKEGVMIEKVFRNSPAQEGGLKKFDFVTEIGGQRVEKADDAHVIIDRAPIGEELSIKVMRVEEKSSTSAPTEITVQVKPEDLSPRLKQLREERMKRKKSKA